MELDSGKIAVTTVFTILVIADIVGNTVVCVVIIKNPDMRTSINYLLINLAVADIMVAVFIAPQFILIHTFQHPDGLTGTWFCKVLTGGNLMWTAATASAFTLVAVAFDRYYAVVHPYGNIGNVTTRKLKVIIPVIWISAAILNTPNFMSTVYSKENNFCGEFWPKQWMAKAYSMTWFAVLGVLPIVTMTGLYSRVVYSLWVKREDQTGSTQMGVMSVRKRVTKVAVVVSVIYGLCWIPDLIVYALIHFSSHHNLGDVPDIISIVLVTCNSTVNPFIYAYVSGRFRRKMKQLICCTIAFSRRVDVKSMTSQGDVHALSMPQILTIKNLEPRSSTGNIYG